VIYSGGYIYSNISSASEPSSWFHNLSLSQILNTQRWHLTVSDSVRYLPEAADAGLSGIPGQGDLGISSPTPGTDTGDDILTNFGSRVTNSASADISRDITGSTSFDASGSYMIQRMIGDSSSGLDTDSESGSAGFSHRIDALSGADVNYSYTSFSYPGSLFAFTSQSATIGYHRKLNRLLSVSGSGGPQWTNSVSPGAPGGTNINFTIDASANYSTEEAGIAASFSRGVRGGSGVVEGSLVDTANLSYNRRLSLVSSASATFAYTQNSSIPNLTTAAFSTTSYSGSFQFTRALGRFISGYLSYTALTQNLEGSLPSSNGFNGLQQIFSGGITYSPRAIHFGH
jgi:hypothetical protein